MTSLVQQHRYKNKTGQPEYARNYSWATAVDFDQQQKDQQHQECDMDAEFNSTEPYRQYGPATHESVILYGRLDARQGESV